jgi:hypothetical protein
MTSEPTFFAASKDWRAWLEENHATASELLVGFYKVGSGRPSMTWPESVDQALCFGWIDGVRKRYDDESYTVRFTPRRAKSTWSAVNINKVEVLKKKGLLHPSGIAAYERHRRLRAASPLTSGGTRTTLASIRSKTSRKNSMHSSKDYSGRTNRHGNSLTTSRHGTAACAFTG